jgi:hypothetical protein
VRVNSPSIDFVHFGIWTGPGRGLAGAWLAAGTNHIWIHGQITGD